MTISKKIQLIAVSIVLVCSACFAQAVFASSDALTNLQASAPTELTSRSNLMTVLGSLVQSILALVGVALILTIIYAGIVWGFMSNGDTTKIKKAQQMIINAVIGLAIVLGAWAIMTFVMTIAKRTAGQTASAQIEKIIVINK